VARSRASRPVVTLAAAFAVAGVFGRASGEPAAWTARGSEGVGALVAPLSGDADGPERLVFDFHGNAGFALAGRTMPVEFPDNFVIRVELRSSARDAPIEIKFVDASGDNVWWYRPAPGTVTADWRTVTIRRRQLQFAWGPTSDRTPRSTARVEVVVDAGGDQAGTLDIGQISIDALPPPPVSWPAPVAHATPESSDAFAAAAVDGNPATAWSCPMPAGAPACTLTIDYGAARELGGLRLEWGSPGVARGYDVALSLDGSRWSDVAKITRGGSEPSWLWLGEAEARFVRLTFNDAPAGRVVLSELALLDIGLGVDRNTFLRAVAASNPRGAFPRGFLEQNYWTLVGADGGSDTGLLSEDGALELGRGGPSLEPFVETRRTSTWASVGTRQGLAGNSLPVPSVEWLAEEFGLAISAVAHRGRVGEGMYARYRVTNRTGHPLSLRLLLAARPYQVNPPAQFLTTPGGVSPIERVDWDGQTLALGGRFRVEPLSAPTEVDAFPFEAKHFPVGPVEAGRQPPWSVSDPAHLATAVLHYDLELAPHGHAIVGVFVPWGSSAGRPTMADLDDAFAVETAYWRQRLGRVTVRAAGSAEARDVSDALKAALAHIILSRDGAMLRPGTRAYARSWIRDGAMMSDALLRLGEHELARAYLAKYATFTFANGKVPCCVDGRGADPVPEHDSPGEFLHLAAAVLRATDDTALLRSVYPRVQAAVAYLARLRAEEAPAAEADPAFQGLLPPSISHEGYSAKPMHSYWDDFWGLRGLDDAVAIAQRLGESADANAFRAMHGQFARDVVDSIAAVGREHRIDFIPGCADLADFDATSTTIALDPGIGPVALPPDALRATFDRYWQAFVARRDGRARWSDYTPYEWRVVGTFVELGQPDRAISALRYFMAGRRPAAWQQWPEVIDRDPRHARFIGDLPHGWVASDFIRSTLDLFAYERDSDRAVVLAAGVPGTWLDGPGVAVDGLRLGSGPLSYRAQRRGKRTDLRVLRGSAVPAGGFVYRLPEGVRPPRAIVDGRPVRFEHGELRLRRAPAHLTLVQT